jgi:Pyruvate-formate lyase-activating enzyme
MTAKGMVFNVQRYSLHDGPGIRTVIFLKGCPLRCAWCCNPESQKPEIENAVRDGRPFTYGKEYTVDEILDVAGRDEAFYGDEGGITLSGGEPFFQAEFALSVLKKAKERRLNTAAETSGHCDPQVLLEAANYLDYVFYDIKALDAGLHKRYTGVDNRLILDNLRLLAREFPRLPVKIRIPLIDGVNDKELNKIKELATELNIEYECLPYHSYGKPKYEYLGREYKPFGEVI